MRGFVFVSLNVNFYQPTRAALEFFYPRLQDGGTIFVRYAAFPPLTIQAVRDVEEELGPFTNYCLHDWAGTLVILKGGRKVDFLPKMGLEG
ncbi:MAG: hypothetical protein LBD66_02780 [Holosporales bacterium]|jgi:hypothetical protein|nr:hypothetical protein [Holosporales bacterium]